jgi:uncharacterized protein
MAGLTLRHKHILREELLAADDDVFAHMVVSAEITPEITAFAGDDLGPLPSQHRRFAEIIRADPGLMHLLRRLREQHLPQWRLVSGCLYQTVWNVLTHRPRGFGIKDYDLIYFDAGDLSWEAEDTVIRRVAAATADCVGPVETRNQARVHLWFPDRFGCAYPQLHAADESLWCYASRVHAVGVRLEDDDRLDVVAPFGLSDVFSMVIRPNYALNNAASHTAKAQRAKTLWPGVTVLSWDAAQCHGAARNEVPPALAR